MAHNNEVTVQIYAGGYKGEAVSYNLIEQKLLYAADTLPVKKVLMGWPLDKTLYEKTADLLYKKNIEFYLWFSVFSETAAVKDLKKLIDFTGRVLERDNENKKEDFFFCCPKSDRNIEKILDIFSENFYSISKCFNGVFLDKIRYPSFANSRAGRGVFSCFCPECLEFYKDKNINIDELKQKLLNEQKIDIIEYYGNGKYLFKDKLMQQFFIFKSEIIYESLKKICVFFRNQNLSIGFDVFAPFLTPFTGQDVVRLSSLCDFIKPMMYRVTNAPAGLPFETKALRQYTGSKIINEGFLSLDSCVEEIKNLNDVSSCPVYAGIEINKVDDIAHVDSFYIEETIRAYLNKDIHRFALSWNLLDMPDDNIKKAAQMLR